MEEITIRSAKREDMDWVNAMYEEIQFKKSCLENEFIVIAKTEGENSGLGRLVIIDDDNIELGGIYVLPNYRRLGIAEKIVGHLCQNNPFKNKIIWCLPFENLLGFYSKFGFRNVNENYIPEQIMKKYDWCNTNGKYKEKVCILFKKDISLVLNV